MNLHYRKIGEGKPIVILHGLFGSGDNWLNIAKKFSEQYSVYLPDMRNHGQSPHSNDMNYDLMAEDIFEFINTHFLKDIILIGHSMGGKIAMTFANLHPETINKLIIVDVAPKIYNHSNKELIEAMCSLDLLSVKSRDDADKFLSEKITDKTIRLFLLKNLYRKDDMSFGWRINLDSIYKNIKTIEGNENNSVYNNPTLFLQGSESKYITENDYPLIKKLFPNSLIIKIEKAGHWIHADKPENVFTAIKDFIE